MQVERYLSEKLAVFDRAVLEAVGANDVRWKLADDGSIQPFAGMQYSRAGGKVRSGWEKRWSLGIPQPTWDLVGRAKFGKSGCWEWLLVKSYEQVADLKRSLEIRDGGSRASVERVLEDAKEKIGVPFSADWTNQYSEHAARIALRAYLTSSKACGRMLFIYFYGDTSGVTSHPSREVWDQAISTMCGSLGLNGKSATERRIFELFIPAR